MAQFTVNREPFPHITIDGLFSENEMKLMYAEWNSMNPFEQGKKDIVLDAKYEGRRSQSLTLSVNRRTFSKELIEGVIQHDGAWNPLRTISRDFTMISWHFNGDFLTPHWDWTVATCVTYYIPNKLSLTGGELIFDDYGITIEPRTGLSVMFPGGVNHRTANVASDDSGDKPARCSMVQFGLVAESILIDQLNSVN